MFGKARLEKSDVGASPYEEELKDKFVKRYEATRLKHERKYGKFESFREFFQFNDRFAARYDHQYLTKFRDCVNTDPGLSELKDVTAFDFTGRRVL